MNPQFLVPETIVHAGGHSAPLDVSVYAGSRVQLTLGITRIVEQESLDMCVEGSPDGESWNARPLAAFPQKFYNGTYALVLDLAAHPGVRFVRARWAVNRWGRGSLQPTFGLYLVVEQLAVAHAMAN